MFNAGYATTTINQFSVIDGPFDVLPFGSASAEAILPRPHLRCDCRDDERTNAAFDLARAKSPPQRFFRLVGGGFQSRRAARLDFVAHRRALAESHRRLARRGRAADMIDDVDLDVLKAGALPAPVKIIEERSIGPSLGEDSIRSGILSSIAALILVALFMVFYYRFGGGVADFAVIINMIIILGIMASLKATLTLPGIAGLILSIGMSVDTNVLIFERIREELDSGKPLRTSVDLGYKKAFSAIIDSHLTSIITGIILYQFGSGPIQGFALTLIFGLVANLFTAIVITHVIFDIMIEKGKHISFG